MFSAYKSKKSIASLLVLIGAMASSASASECSSLQFKQTEMNGINYVTRIKLNNGHLLESEVTKYDKVLSLKAKRYGLIGEEEKRVISGTRVYFLEEGEHHLTVELWKKSSFKKLFTTSWYKDTGTDGMHITPKKVSTFKLKIEKDLSYELDFGFDGEVSITSTKSSCILKNNNLLAAVPNEVSEIADIKTLPNQLEQRLRVAMNKLFASGQPIGVVRSQVSPFFGAVKDDNYQGKEGEVRLLSVLPFSLAHNVGLLSGDVIVGYGDTAYPTLVKFLESLKFKKEVEFNVLRNGTLVELKMENKPVVIPQIVYGENEKDIQKGFIGGIELDDELQFEFSQLLLEVSHYYLKNNYSGNLNLVRHNSVNKEFGLIGTLNKISHSKYAITVDEVFPFSAADALGLKVGDIIYSVNNKKMNTRDLTHINSELKELKEGEEYTINIHRGGNTVTLIDNFKLSEFSAFNLIIDLDAADKYQTIIATVGSIKRKVFMVGTPSLWRGIREVGTTSDQGAARVKASDAARDMSSNGGNNRSSDNK